MKAEAGPFRTALLALCFGVALAGCDRQSPQQADAPATTPPASTAGAPAEVVPEPGTVGETEPTPGAASASAAGTTEDSALAAKVRSALQADAGVSSSSIVVEARQGEVLLSGFVRDQDQIDKVIRVAESVEGVQKVANRINVNATAGTPGYPPGASTGGGQDSGESGGSGSGTSSSSEAGDSIITTKVKSALLADPGVRGSDIVVETREGEVLLSGFVHDSAQIDKAVQLAKGVEGVKKVTNKMTVKKS